MYPLGMYSMYSMYNNTTMMPGNVHENLKARYGVGHPDFGRGPIRADYPMEILPAAKTRAPRNWFIKMLRQLFN